MMPPPPLVLHLSAATQCAPGTMITSPTTMLPELTLPLTTLTEKGKTHAAAAAASIAKFINTT